MLLNLEQVGVEVDGRWLVRDARLRLESGSMTALVGPNGSGKTTLLRLCGGLWRPSAGSVTLDGEDLARLARRVAARRIAFTPQDTHLEFRFTVRDVVAQGRHAHLGRFEREGVRDLHAIEAAMERADVREFASRYVTELSGGERQRVLIARSLATEAEAILLDEPTANLDIRHALDVLDLCRALASEGKIICLALHDLNHALRYATHLALLDKGIIVAAGAPDEVLTDERIAEVFGVRAERAMSAGGERTLIFKR